MDRKSTRGICTFVGCCLTSWFSKKQTALAISTTEAEYISAGKACQQALWMKQALIDYDVRIDDVPTMCDNKGAIDLSKNPVQHSIVPNTSKLAHFLRDNVQNQYQLSYSDEGEMFVEFVIQNQLFSYSLENFAQILGVPCEGACVFSDRWRVDKLIYGIPTDGPYQTNLPPVEDIISSIRVDRDGQVRRIRHEEEMMFLAYQVLTREIETILKPLEEIIRKMSLLVG
ncbi:hypothetical protein Tco_0780429 [Tanacetum coccineum]